MSFQGFLEGCDQETILYLCHGAVTRIDILGFIASLFILLNGCLFIWLKYCKCFEVRKRHGLPFVGF